MQAQCPSVVLVAQALYQPLVRVWAVVLRSCVVPVAVVLGAAPKIGRVRVGRFHPWPRVVEPVVPAEPPAIMPPESR